jgi:hypothetical protein
MRKLINSSSIILVILFVIQSCTIEKRAFMPGYHIDWNHSKTMTHTKSASEKTDDGIAKNEKDSIVNHVIITENNVVENTVLTEKNEISQKIEQPISKEKIQISSGKIKQKIESKEGETNNVAKKNTLYNIKKFNNKKNYDDDNGGDLNVFSLISFIAAILSVAFVGITLISLTLAVLGLIFGILGNKELSRGDYLYNLNKTFALIGIILSSIMILVNLIIVVSILFILLLLF